jgi:transcriptional regulator with XRE-family HTH domain
MAVRATSVTPGLLVWAREQAGLSQDQAAHYISKTVDDIISWESGTTFPTYSQLERLAENLYHRPVALFFLPEPPEEANAGQEFRTLPDFDAAQLTADTRFAVRIGRAYQQSLYELTGGLNPSRKKILDDLQLDPTGDVRTEAKRIRAFLGNLKDMRWQHGGTKCKLLASMYSSGHLSSAKSLDTVSLTMLFQL